MMSREQEFCFEEVEHKDTVETAAVKRLATRKKTHNFTE